MRVTNKDGFEQAVMDAHKIGHGHLGWSGMSELFVMMGFDRMFFRSNSKKKRIRKKKMKRLLTQVFLRNVFENCEVVEPQKDGSTYRLCEHCGLAVDGAYICECQKK